MYYKTLPAAFGLLLLTAGAAAALDVKQTADVAQPADKVWAAIGDFCGIASWHPVVASCDMKDDGGAKVRTLTTKDGGKLVESLDKWDDGAMSYTYKILESPLPVKNYVSTLRVIPGDDGTSTLEWSSTFDAKDAPDDKAIEVITGIYKAGFDGIKAKF